MCEERDVQMAEKQQQIDYLQKKEAELLAAIKQKEREIGDDVDDERAKLEAELEAARRDRDEALLNADEMQKAGDQMSKAMAELSQKPSDKVGETLQQAEGEYDAHRERKKERDAITKSGQEAEAKAAKDEADGPKEEKPPDPAKEMKPKELWPAKTGEQLELSLWGYQDKIELRATEPSTGLECSIPVSKALIKELDTSDPWTDLYSRVGVSDGPPRTIVIAEKLGDKVISAQPSNTEIRVEMFRFDARRFWFSGQDLSNQSEILPELVIGMDNISSDLGAKIDSCTDHAELFDLLAGKLLLQDGALILKGN